MKIFYLISLILLRSICISQENTEVTSTLKHAPVFECLDSDISLKHQGNAISALARPQSSSVTSSFLLSGSGLYQEIRITVLAFKLRALGSDQEQNESCLECCDSAGNWLSIAGGNLQDFNDSISRTSNNPELTNTANTREIVFLADEATLIDDLMLDLYFTLPGINPDTECTLNADFFLQFTFRDSGLKECEIILPVSVNLTLNKAPFTLLKDKLDGFYYPAYKGIVNFKYIERYSVPEGKKLNYSIYSKTRQLIKNQDQPNPGMPILPIYTGTNFLSLDLSEVKDMTANEFYVIEVLSDKKDKYYLRFKFIK